jgi:Glycerol-3-phosphate dehydrogenase
MNSMEHLKNKPIAVLGGGAVGKTCAADCKLAGREVRLFDLMPFAKTSLRHLDRTGLELGGTQRNLYGFHRAGRVKLDLVTSNMAESVRGAGHIIIASPAFGHEPLFRELIPHLEDGQVINIFTDNFGTLVLRRLMRESGCTRKVIVGGWSSAPYGTRVENVGGLALPFVGAKYRAITLRAATLPLTDLTDFIESTKHLPCLDAVTTGDGVAPGRTVLDIGLANVNPVIHVPATILGVSTMENWGKIFGDFNTRGYSMYAHALCPSICEVQYQFYNEEIALAEAIGVDLPRYSYESFFSRRSILAQEYMGLDENGKDNMVLPLDQPTDESNPGPDSIRHRYVTEDVPVGCKIYHELGRQYGVKTPIIDSMILLAGTMLKKNYFSEGYSLDYLGIKDMGKEELLEYLNDGIYSR